MTTRRTLLVSIALGAFATASGMEILVMHWPSFCGAPTGSLSADVIGGTPPYTYLWSNGSDQPEIFGLEPGTYWVTVTDADMEEETAFVEVPSIDYTTFGGGESIGPPQTQNWCSAAMPFAIPWGSLQAPSMSAFGPGPWTYTVNGVLTPTVPNSCPIQPNGITSYLPLDHPVGTVVTISYTDGNGCPGVAQVTVKPPIPEIPVQVLSVSGSCAGLAQGSVVVATGPWVQPPVDIPYDVGIALRVAGGDFLQPACGISGVRTAFEQGGVHTFTGLAPGDYEVVVRSADNVMQVVPDYASCQFVSFTVPDLGGNCGVVTGRAFMDYNLNCTRQFNEPYVPGGIMEVQPGPYYATTDAQGLYTLALPIGNYTLQQQSDVLGEHCVGGPIPFTISGGQTSTVDLPDTASVPLDVRALLSSGIARPGFEFQYAISVRNLTPSASGAISLTFTFDPTLEYLSATPAPSSVSGNTITWDQAQLTAFQQRSYQVRFEVPPDVGLLGYELVGAANVTTANTDGNPANNSATNLRTITGAYVPNDKLATTSEGSTSVWQINADEWIDYTIRFQNTGTDTAFNVLITDTLPANLDPGTIIMGAASHTFTWELRDQGTLKFYFPNILLPDSNINEPLSHGFVGFRIRPRLPLLPGDEIENIANIYFDFNPPVITEPSVLVASTGTGGKDVVTDAAIRLQPNPAVDMLHVMTGSGVFRHLRVRSMDGRLMLEQTGTSDRTVIDISALPAGAYLLECVVNDGERPAQQRFIKLRP